MGAVSAIGTAIRGVTTNPILLVLTGAFALLQVPTLLIQPTDPLLAMFVSSAISLAILAVIPFYQGGLIAMADEARTGRTTLETFLRAGKTNYVPLALAFVLFIAVFMALGMIGGIGTTIAGGRSSWRATWVPGPSPWSACSRCSSVSSSSRSSTSSSFSARRSC